MSLRGPNLVGTPKVKLFSHNEEGVLNLNITGDISRKLVAAILYRGGLETQVFTVLLLL